MPLDPALASQMQQTVLVATSTAVNGNGERVYSAAASHKGRIFGKHELFRDRRGQEFMSQKQIVLSSTVSVDVHSKLWLESETTSADPGWIPCGVAMRVDENGANEFQKIWLGILGGENG